MDEETILEGLRRHFKFDKFKSQLQKDAVTEICQRKHDVLVSMPTGSGKSLCYQLPAVLHSGKITVVFSPLLALIKDQIDHMLRLKIRAASLNSKITKAEREALIADLKSTSPNTRLLYVTPEQAATATFKSLYHNLHNFNKLGYLVVDEAHCVSEWGHDFRPQYSKLGELRENCNIPCIALTATASVEVTKDIISSLRLANNHKTFKTSCFRENLYYDVFYPNILEDPFKHLKTFIDDCLNVKEEENMPKSKKSCGIIYCRTRDQTEVLMERLNKLGVKALCYHAGLKNHERLEFQDKWQDGDVPVICATISFGMGVDKSTVRFVVHWGVPKDPASFYQESGRAGRDGKPSRCRVYYNRSDSKAVEFHISQDLAKAGNNTMRRKTAEISAKGFKQVVQYCENPTECRHMLFSKYFGEPPPNCINRCDFCTDKKKLDEMVELFLTKSIQFSTRMASADDMDYGELYGGGRKGVAEEAANDGSDDNECAHAAFKREQAAKKASKDLIQKQFELRKNTQEVSQESIDKLFSKHSRVKAASSTSNKVKGLTLATRELYLSRVLDVLYKNYTECQEEPTLDRKDVEDCSIDIEYSIFSTTTNMTMYRNAMAKLVSNTKRLTDDKIVHEKLLMFEPRPEKLETLTDLFRNIKKKQLIKRQATTVDKAILNTDFQTARQALQAQTPVQEPSDNSSVEKKEAKVCCDNYPVCQCTTKDMEGKGRKNFKSLFGEEDSDDGEKSSENSASLNWETVKHIVEATNSSKTHGDKEESKHKTKSHKESRHRHRHEEGRKPDDDKDEWKEKHKKHRHEEERKRRNSSDRDEDRKRKKEEDAAPAEACGSEDTKVSDNNNMREVEQATERVEEVKVSGKQNGDTGKKQRLKKTEVGGLVVKLLTPAYVDRRFESRDTFKTMARNISHALVNKDETEIREYVENFLKKNEEITSQTTI